MIMSIVLKRKVATELLTTYLPTILLLLITFTTVFFDKDLFGDAIAVNLTIMLVMTTIFTSKIEELPPTSDTKMIDIWLIFCLLVPFAFTLIQTAIECYREDEIEETHEKWAETRDGKKVVFGNNKKSCSDYQAKVLNGDGSMQEATIEEGKEEVIKVASVEDFPKKKTQRSSPGMLRTLQWIGEF